MPSFNPMTVASTLRKMFTTCPLPSANADPEAALRVFFEVLDGHSTDAIVDASKAFMTGQVPGYNPAFAPTAPQFVSQVRRIEDDRLKIVNLNRQAQLQIEARVQDEIVNQEKSDDARNRIAELAKATAMRLVPEKKDDPEYLAAMKAQVAKNDALFADEFLDMPNGKKISRTLAKMIGFRDA